MTILTNPNEDQSQFEKALEEAKKQMSETNKKFADAMKELNKIWKDQKQEYKTLVNMERSKAGVQDSCKCCHLTGIFFLVITSSP